MGMTPAPRQFLPPSGYGNAAGGVLTPAKAAPLAPQISFAPDPMMAQAPASAPITPAPMQKAPTQEILQQPIPPLRPKFNPNPLQRPNYGGLGGYGGYGGGGPRRFMM